MEKNTVFASPFGKRRGELVWIDLWRNQDGFTTVLQAVKESVKLHFEDEENKIFNEAELEKALADFDFIEFGLAGRVFNIQVHETDKP